MYIYVYMYIYIYILYTHTSLKHHVLLVLPPSNLAIETSAWSCHGGSSHQFPSLVWEEISSQVMPGGLLKKKKSAMICWSLRWMLLQHGSTMVFSWFSHGFPMVFPWFPKFSNPSKQRASVHPTRLAAPSSCTKSSKRPRQGCSRYSYASRCQVLKGARFTSLIRGGKLDHEEVKLLKWVGWSNPVI